MKKLIYRRRLLPVPYSIRPDQIERGLVILRALRSSSSSLPGPTHEQLEFSFTGSPNASLVTGSAP